MNTYYGMVLTHYCDFYFETQIVPLNIFLVIYLTLNNSNKALITVENKAFGGLYLLNTLLLNRTTTIMGTQRIRL